MSQQSKLDQYFKKQSGYPTPIPNKMNTEYNLKKRSLSLKKSMTPVKSPKKKHNQTIPDIVEILSSSDENDEGPTPTTTPLKKNLKFSPKSVSKSLNITVNTPQEINAKASKSADTLTEEKTQMNNGNMLQQRSPTSTNINTPIKPHNFKTAVNLLNDAKSVPKNATIGSETPVHMEFNISPSTILGVENSPKTPSKSSPSPGSANKYFSPTKKRVVQKKSPVKRSLTFTMDPLSTSPITKMEQSETYKKAYKGQDDKTNFMLNIIENCLSNDSLKALLEENSQILLQKCMEMPTNSLRLVCRLFWRLPGWYRFTKLGSIASEDKKQKMSTNELYEVVTPLVESGLLTQAQSEGESSLSLDDHMKLLQKDELQQICKELKLNMKSKQNSVDALKAFCKQAPISNFFSKNKINNNETRVMNTLRIKTGLCYKLSEEARKMLNYLHVLMYLGINDDLLREKKLELVLINDKIKRETYPVDKNMVLDNASIVFETKEQFLRYYKARMLYEDYLTEESTEKRCDIILQAHALYKQLNEDVLLRYMSLPVWLHRFTSAQIYLKLLEAGVVELKKHRMYDNAVLVLDTLLEQVAFRQHKRAEWVAEKSLILHRCLHIPEKAAIALLEGLQMNLSDEAKEVLRSRAKLLSKQQNIELKDELRESLRTHADKLIRESSLPGDHICKNPVDNHNQRGKLKFQIHTEEGRKFVSVEEYCIEYYLAQGTFTHGEHWEGRMVNSIFHLLFWDIIYSKPVGVNGIFLSYYQRHPLDLYTDSFYVNRKTLIDKRLALIESSTEEIVEQIMLKTWEERPEYELSDIVRSVPWSTTQAVAQCLGPRALSAICRRLATNYAYCHSGFPDVTVWNVFTKKIKFVEVKSDADSPSIKQLQWIKYLRENDIDAGFCYVGANTTRSQARPLHDVTSNFE